MQNKTHSLGLEIGLLVVAVLASSAFYWSHTRQPYSAPQKTISLLLQAAGTADLGEFQKASTASFYSGFVRHFGEQKYDRVFDIYQRVARLGMPRWYEYHQRALQGASVVYERLHESVAALGREAFNRLPVEERMRLMDDMSKYQGFVFDQGVQALSPDERGRIQNVEDFRLRRDSSQFMRREGWNYLSEEDRSALGNPAALSDDMTPEKLAFLDRVGLPLLDAKLKKELGEIQRSELSDPEAFKFKYGEPLAKDYFSKTKIPKALRIHPCSFPREDSSGSLLRGEIAKCQVTVQARKQVQQIEVTLRKLDFHWLVETVQPAPYKISW